MPLYKADPNDSTKQIPDVQGANRQDRTSTPTVFEVTKSPSFVIVTKNLSNAGVGFYFGTETTFSASAATEGQTTIYSGSSDYDLFDELQAGTYNISPIAVSGSSADVAKIKFVYKSGLATGGF